MDLLGLEVKDLEWYQMVTRAIIVFIFALAMIRVTGMRTFGTKSAFDIVLSITLGAILSRAISGHYPFFACLLTAATLCIIHRLIAFLSYKSKFISKLTEGEPVVLYKDGKKIMSKMKLYNISDSDLKLALHKQNMDGYDKVKAICFEHNGEISIIKKEE